MGRKVNPIGFRLGIVTDWESKWFAERNYTEQLHEDLMIRKMIFEELPRAGISKVELERSANKVDVTLYTSKPGIVIGAPPVAVWSCPPPPVKYPRRWSAAGIGAGASL